MTSDVLTYPVPARFSELASGDLFLYFHPKGPQFCIATGSAQQKLIAPFTAALGAHDVGPTLSLAENYTTGKEIDPPVLSFGKNYTLQLSCRSSGWRDISPPEGVPCILVTQDGDKLLRLSPMRDAPSPEFGQSPTYVDLATGIIHQGMHAEPAETPPPSPSKPRVHLFVVEWQLLTKQAAPREILAIP